MIWQSGYSNAGGGPYFTILQMDGNLVTYPDTPAARANGSGYAVWAANTFGNAVTTLQVTNGGQVQIVNGLSVIWQRPAAPANPAPTLSGLSPASATAGGASFTLTITGTNFLPNSTVTFGTDTSLTPTVVSATQLTVAVPAADIATAGAVAVTVTNPAPGGGTASANFTVAQATPALVVTASPNPAALGQSVTLTATLTGGDAPTGTVQFQDGGASLGAPAALSGGAASLTLSTLSAGTHQITAVYTGDANNAAATAPAAALTVTSAAPAPVLQVNAGGKAAAPFAADRDFTGGTAYATAAAVTTAGVTNPAPAAVYQTQRYGNFTYALPGLTPGGSYTLRLHLSEIYWTAAGRRLFSVRVNGAQVLTSFDVFKAAGGRNKAVVEAFPVTAGASGQVVVQFVTNKDNACVSGLEILH